MFEIAPIKDKGYIGPKKTLSTLGNTNSSINPFVKNDFNFENCEELEHAQTPRLDTQYTENEIKEDSEINDNENSKLKDSSHKIKSSNRESRNQKFYKVNTKYFKIGSSGWSGKSRKKEKPFLSKKSYDRRILNSRKIFEFNDSENSSNNENLSHVSFDSNSNEKKKIPSEFQIKGDTSHYLKRNGNQNEVSSSDPESDEDENFEDAMSFISLTAEEENEMNDENNEEFNISQKEFNENPDKRESFDFAHLSQLNRMKSIKLIKSIKNKPSNKNKE